MNTGLCRWFVQNIHTVYFYVSLGTIGTFGASNLAKMIVPIKRDGIIEDWAIIDLQGDLKFEKIKNSDKQLIGDLHFTKTGIPILIIGIHVLHGKEIMLEKPLIVLERHRSNMENEIIGEEDSTKTEYIVKAIVKKKLLFKSRPKPIVTHVPKQC